MLFVLFFPCDLQDFKFYNVNSKAFGASFLYWVDFTVNHMQYALLLYSLFGLSFTEDGRSMTTFYYYYVNHQSGLQSNTFSKLSYIFLILQNVPQIMSFHLRYMMVSYVKRFWSNEGRKVGHSALAQLPIYRTHAIITHTFYPIFEGQKRFKELFFRKILTLSTVSIQEQFIIKSGLWWRAYGNEITFVDLPSSMLSFQGQKYVTKKSS